MKKILLFFIATIFIAGMYGCSSTPTAVPTDTPTPTPTVIPTATPTPIATPTPTLVPIETPVPNPESGSMENEIQIGFELNSYEKEGLPYTDVIFIIHSGKKEEKIFIGSYVGDSYVIESFENRAFFNPNSIVGCQVFYAGGGDNVFAYLEGLTINVKHIEFVLGNEEMDSEAITDEVVISRVIPNNSIIKALEHEID